MSTNLFNSKPETTYCLGIRCGMNEILEINRYSDIAFVLNLAEDYTLCNRQVSIHAFRGRKPVTKCATIDYKTLRNLKGYEHLDFQVEAIFDREFNKFIKDPKN